MKNKSKSILKKTVAFLICTFMLAAPFSTLTLYAAESTAQADTDGKHKVRIDWKAGTDIASNGIAYASGSITAVISVVGTPAYEGETVKVSAKTFDISAKAYYTDANGNKQKLEYTADEITDKEIAVGGSYEMLISVGTQKTFRNTNGNTPKDDAYLYFGTARYTKQFGVRITHVGENAVIENSTVRAYLNRGGTPLLLNTKNGGKSYTYSSSNDVKTSADYYANDYSVFEGYGSGAWNLYQKETAKFTFNSTPREIITNGSSNMASVLSYYPETEIYYTGDIKIGGYYNYNAGGFTFKVIQGGSTVFTGKRNSVYGDFKKSPFYTQWLKDTSGKKAFETTSSSGVVYFDTDRDGYSYWHKYTDNGKIQVSLYNHASSYNKRITDLQMVATAIDSTAPQLEGYFVDDSIVYGYKDGGSSDVIYLSAKFSEPVQVTGLASDNKNVYINATIGGKAIRFYYDSGTCTDTLVFKATLDGDYNGDTIEIAKNAFFTSDGTTQARICDFMYNTDGDLNDANVTLSSKVSLSCKIDTRTPTIKRTTDAVSTSQKTHTVGVKLSDIRTEGKITYKWSAVDNADGAGLNSWSTLSSYSTTGVNNISGAGLNGEMYLHVRAESIAGNRASKTFGAYNFDNTAPVISAPDDLKYSQYQKEQTINISIGDAHGTKINKIYAFIQDKNEEYISGWNNRVVYEADSESTSKMISSGDGKYSMVLSCINGDITLPEEGFGSYTIGFKVEDKLGNISSSIIWISSDVKFDKRDTYSITHSSNAENNVKLKDVDVYYRNSSADGVTVTVNSVGQNTSGQTYKLYSIKLDGTTVYTKANGWSSGRAYGDYGFASDPTASTAVTETNNEMKATLAFDPQVNGWYEVVYIVNDTKQSQVASFYVSATDATPTNYSAIYDDTRLLINKVWKITTPTYYSKNNALITSTYDKESSGAVAPIFSSPEKAYEYAKYMELQDVSILYIEDTAMANDLNGGLNPEFRKADGEPTAEVGHTWLCYKSISWTPTGSDRADRSRWVYYYYTGSKVTAISEAQLSTSIVSAIEDNAVEIAGVEKVGNTISAGSGKYTYLTKNNGGTDAFGQPSYRKTAVFYEPQEANGCFNEPLRYTGDSDIYSSYIDNAKTIFGDNAPEKLPLIANYTFSLSTGYSKLYYRLYGGASSDWIPISNNSTIKDIITGSGRYEFAEISNGYRIYQVYCDISAPSLSYTAKRGTTEINNIFTQSTDGSASAFNTSLLVLNKVLTPDSYVLGDVGITEYDEYAYVYFSRSAFSTAEDLFFSLSDINNGETKITIPDGEYEEMIICDRLGNIIARSPLRISKKLPMASDGSGVVMTDLNITFKFNCRYDEVEEFYIKQGTEVRASSYTGTEYSYTEGGNYTYYIRDIYGNVATDTVEFVRKLPEVFFEYKMAGSNTYVEMLLSSSAENNTAVVGAMCEKIGDSTYRITSSSDIRIGYVNTARYGIRQTKPENVGAVYTADTSHRNYNYWNISMNNVQWEVQIYHLNDPGTYITITCINDTSPPQITANAGFPNYDFLETEMNGDIGYEKLDPIEQQVGDGDTVDADNVTISWDDQSSIVSVYYTINGGEIINIDRNSEAFKNKSITLPNSSSTEKGTYVITVIDSLNNMAKFTVTLKHVPLKASMSVGEENVELSEKTDPDGVCLPTQVQTGKPMQITVKESVDLTFSWYKEIPGTSNLSPSIYQLHYVDGKILISVGLIDTGLIEDLTDDFFYYDPLMKDSEGNSIYFVLENTGDTPADLIVNGDLVIKYTFKKGTGGESDTLTLYFQNLTVETQHWQIRLTDTQGTRPMMVEVVSSTIKPNMQLETADGVSITVVPDTIVGANQELFVRGNTADIETVSVFYSSKPLSIGDFEKRYERYFELFDKSTGNMDTLFEEGYYKIVVVNKYGNRQEIYVRLSYGLVVDVAVNYENTDSREYQFKSPVEYSLNTNGSVDFTIWHDNVKISVLRNGANYSITHTDANASKRFSLQQIGEYEVKVVDDCSNTYVFKVVIKEPEDIAYNEYLTGFNLEAVRYADGYTNAALSIDKNKIDADGIKYVAYRLKNNDKLTVLYDLVSQERIEYYKNNFSQSIGKEDGVYEVVFEDLFGNTTVKTVYISSAPQLSITRHTQSSTKDESIDISSAVANGAWSNYIVTLSNTAEQYSILINGKVESAPFDAEGKRVFKLSPGLGEAQESIPICYIDEYGNKYEFTVQLYRKTPSITQNVQGEIINKDGNIYIKGDVSYTWSGDTIVATYIKDRENEVSYLKGSIINKDGLYQLMFVDIAGNTSNIVVTRDTTVEYELVQGTAVVPTGISVSNTLSIKPVGEVLTVKEIVRDGALVESNAMTFAAHGFYRIILEDKVGNITQLEFDIINHPMKSFTYEAHPGFAISQVFFNLNGQKISYASAIATNASGNYCYAFDADGSYDIELWHIESNEYYTFNVDIDNVAPKATAIGVKNGGVTRSNVKFAGLVSGDIVEIYKNGELISTVTIKRDGETPEISDPGQYSIVIKDLAGNLINYTFEREYTTNAAANAMICLLLVGTSALGIVFLRGRGKIRTK